MGDKDDLDRAFEMAAEWVEDKQPLTHIMRPTLTCPDCKATIETSNRGWRCGCHQWRSILRPRAGGGDAELVWQRRPLKDGE